MAPSSPATSMDEKPFGSVVPPTSTFDAPTIPVLTRDDGSKIERNLSDEPIKVVGQPSMGPPPVDESALLTGARLVVTISCMMLAMFCIALDQTILATALPKIGSTFNSFSQQGWVAASFILTQAGTVLLFGQMCRIYKAKWILLASIFVFELGSLIAGVAPSIDVLIFGRCVSGIGAAGLFSSLITVFAQITTLQQRPKVMGFFGAVFGIASVIGPLMGGAIVDNTTWRWVFYLNLPVGGIASAAIFYLLKASDPLGWKGEDRTTRALLRATLRIDWLGAFLFFNATLMLVLALQWAGNQKPWGDSDVIGCLAGAGATYVVFVLWERYMGDKAMVPPAIMKSLSIYCILVFSFFVRFGFFLAIYYIALFYQAAKGDSAIHSAVQMFPLVIFMVVSAAVSGQLIARVTKSYWPFLVIGPILSAIGGGLLYTINGGTSEGAVIGYQILVAIGTGVCFQNSNLAIQVEFKDTPRLIAQSSSLAICAQFLGGTVALSIGQTAFATQLAQNLAKYAPGVDATTIIQDPLSIHRLPLQQISGAIKAYTDSLDVVYILITAASGASLISAIFIKNIRIPDRPVTGAKSPVPTANAMERGDSDEKGSSVGDTESTGSVHDRNAAV